MLNTLFPVEIPKDEGSLQHVDITTTILYMSTKELKEFKTLCKEGIKRLWGVEFQQKGNLTDYILHLIRQDNKTK